LAGAARKMAARIRDIGAGRKIGAPRAIAAIP